MEVLTGSTGTNIKGGHFSNVGGDQNNYYQTNVQNGGKKGKTNRDLPELSEFTEVKRGDIYKYGNSCYSWRFYSNGKDTEAAIYHAEINIVGPFGQKKYTIKTYHGRSGRKEWRREFLRCSRDWHGDVPLFGYNKSSVPSLIFYGELIPIVHVEVGLVGRLYFGLLKKALGCLRNELWMDPTKGSFCRGPVGPKCVEWFDEFGLITIPSDVEFLKEDILIRYLSGIKHDFGLIWAHVYYSGHVECLKEISSGCHSQIISSLTNSTIAFNRNVRWDSFEGCVHSEGRTADGATRFLLTDRGRYIKVNSTGETFSWLSQAPNVFHAHNIRFDGDLSNFKLIFATFELKGTLQKSRYKHQRRHLGGLIYLFLLPSPSPNMCFYFWTHNPSGQDPLSSDTCKYLGLPFKLSVTVKYIQYSWPTKIYKALHDYQVERGFDPTTTNFVQSFGYPTFEIVATENHFCNVEEDSASTRPVQGATEGYLLSALHRWFTTVRRSIFKRIRKIRS
ncbi:hypothetical protein L218DRAFT_405676 [Marasmius fiardii PR-910]|nr:hypothetical protein L218DRAFT_405676 [Marasmius fiardii PR-910]